MVPDNDSRSTPPEEEPPSSSPSSSSRLAPESLGGMQKFSLYETRSKFYMIGRDKSKTHWRVLKIDRSDPLELNIREDLATYSGRECSDLLRRIHEGNKATGGLKFVTACYGIIGFIKFLGPYYMLIITRKRQIGSICGHNIYAVSKSEIVPLENSNLLGNTVNARSENRYKKLLCMVDLTKDFFFSYSYHVMRSLQKNMSQKDSGPVLYDTMFVWNEYLTRGIRNLLHNTLWTVALVYGFFKQATLSTISGKDFILTLIARRSRHYAGTRYLKRGVNENGRVANDVETEQIVFEDVPEGGFPTQLSSIVQNRGSIPLFWSQETSRLNIKPDIILFPKDNTYEATRLHFENLASRYGRPIIILNLIKTNERRPRESILRSEFANAIECLNKDLPQEDRLMFLHWDLHKHMRSKATNVLLLLGRVAAYTLTLTSFFYCQVTPELSTFDGCLQFPYFKDEKGGEQSVIPNGNEHSSEMEIEKNGNEHNSEMEIEKNGNEHNSETEIERNGNEHNSETEIEKNGNEHNSETEIEKNGNEHNSETEIEKNGNEHNSEMEIGGDEPSNRVANGNDGVKLPMFQKGVLRTNCIDCLDRTNVAQYAYGLAALGKQLQVLGITDEVNIGLDDPIANELMRFYERMGDTLAHQYGGSAAHNKVFSERRGQLKAVIQSQEFFRTLQRYYSNAYMDAEKQNAINVFLGYFEPEEGKPDLWELNSVQHGKGTEEGKGGFFHRSFSDGNIIRESSLPISKGSGFKHEHSVPAFPVNDNPPGKCAISESSAGISACENEDTFSSRYTSSSVPGNGQTSDMVNSSNFLDVDWLSSSGNSCDDELFERINGTMGDQSIPSASEYDSSLGGTEHSATTDRNYENLKDFSESFAHWVASGEALCH
ncbi:phosphoinositide phosphatase SAC3-like [Impatiens glandulifera]|uniref:phosphoinositide phosphatase SAC3-like n=1 Tax=Impatiens glandulifera TaxID=253017 RepID=UPI001FB0BCB2|nr:phosphoinositide phosphatase SAC3-like [Impatiens glandulifera]